MTSLDVPRAVAGTAKQQYARVRREQQGAGKHHGAAQKIGRLFLRCQLPAHAPAAGDDNRVRWSHGMADAAATAGKAAKAKDVDALLDAGDVLYTTCEDCHRQFGKR